MEWFAIIKRHYETGRYNTAQVGVFVIAGKITPTEYETITRNAYEAPAE